MVPPVSTDESGRGRYQRPRALYEQAQAVTHNYVDICEKNEVRPNKQLSLYLKAQGTVDYDLSKQVLSVHGFKAFCETIQAIKGQHTARQLLLRYNNLDNSSIQLLCQTFHGASQLEELDLSGNCFGKRSIGALAQLAQSCEKLRVIKLEKMVQLDAENIIHLKKAKEGLRVDW